MPECMLCDSQNFDILDGLYFCRECGTQSQDVQEESAVYQENVDIRLCMNKKVKVKKHVDFGKPWFTLEGFQILIKAQVEFLVKKGVDPKLKDIVGQMWFRYVELSSDAFQTNNECSSEDQIQKTNVEMQKRRDDVMKERILQPSADSMYRSTKPIKKKQQDDLDALELSSEIAREDFYEDDDPTRVLFDSEDEEDSLSEISYVGSINCKKSVKSVGYMIMSTTLSFCYLGLLWLSEPICISDLIRWVREGHLPYFNASSLFPSYMKLSQSDVVTFSGRVLPGKRKVYCSASALKTYLSLPDLPEQGVELYIARYLVDFQLPACVHRCVYNIMNMVKLDYNKLGHLRCYDDLGMAYIILTLKLIYGLDGKTECELTKLAEDIPPDGNAGSYFPTWSDVLRVVYTCQNGLLRHGVPWTIEELGLMKDSRDYGRFCHEKIFGSWRPPMTVDRFLRNRTGYKGLNREKQEEYARTFERFLDDDGEGEMPVNLKDASSFPLLSGERELTKERAKNEVKTQCGASDSDTSSSRTANEPLKHAKRRGLSWEKISNYYENENDEESVSTEEDTFLLSSSSLDSDTRPNKRRRSSVPSKWGTPFVSYNLPACIYTKMPKSVMYWTQSWKDAVLPVSFRHLVELCAKVIEEEPSALYTVVQEMEKTLFA